MEGIEEVTPAAAAPQPPRPATMAATTAASALPGEMSFSLPFLQPVRRLCDAFPAETGALRSALAAKGTPASGWDAGDRQDLLNGLAALLAAGNTQLALAVINEFRPVAFELIMRVTDLSTASPDLGQHERISHMLSLALHVVPHVLPAAVRYFKSGARLSPFARLDRGAELSPQQALALAETTHRLVRACPTALPPLWSWSGWFRLLESPEPRVRLHAAMVTALLHRASDGCREDLLAKYAPQGAAPGDVRGATLEACLGEWLEEEEELACASLLPALASQGGHSATPAAQQPVPGASFAAPDLKHCVDVAGLVLPTARGTGGGVEGPPFVCIPSMAAHLQALAMALLVGRPILLEGETGSGKTILVEHVAHLCGHKLLKVQLGDQTDSKALLGSYVCTDTPGKFRYQKGVLVEAVQSGCWLLLEDVHLANMDIVSVLLPLLESRRLFVPSRGETHEAASEFQLFATQRTVASGQRVSGHHVSLLDHLWTCVRLAVPSVPELRALVEARFGVTERVSDVLLGVFADCQALQAANARPISTRDLIKLCQRVGAFGRHEAEHVFAEAHDLFCGSQPAAQALPAARCVGEHLGLNADAVALQLGRTPAAEASESQLRVGRVALERAPARFVRPGSSPSSAPGSSSFANTGQVLRLMERVSVCVAMAEPVLLVGETGTGKTTAVQQLARQLRRKLVVMNMSQQSDNSDLLGGFKPIDLQTLAAPVLDEFEALFSASFSRKQNQGFLKVVRGCFAKGRWAQLVRGFANAVGSFQAKVEAASSTKGGAPQPRKLDPALRARWAAFATAVARLRVQVEQEDRSFAFAFVEGALVKAVRSGAWVLLDEINLASQETLECLNGLLDGRTGSITLTERGDTEPVARHPDFRLFACMNPATDVGKRNLPPGLRNRFTEFYVDEMQSKEDLALLVRSYLGDGTDEGTVAGIVDFYCTARAKADTALRDGANRKPHFSLRTLCCALIQAVALEQVYGRQRALYEGLCMSFLTQLDASSFDAMHACLPAILRPRRKKPPPLPPRPEARDGQRGFVEIAGFWLTQGDHPVRPREDFILTASTLRNLEHVARVVCSKRFPVLLQGPTSSGKTSLVEYMAHRTGHRFLRINNHEHTDIQEYLGSYFSDEGGRLVFQEGPLVRAVRHGHWIVLDELNLAPSDVLEALNRLLDDNRELFIPETQESVRAHPDFMLFATQNPPGLYGGRKVLSRAFRNRFIELHVNDISSADLQVILQSRSGVPTELSKRMIGVMKDLQQQRQGTRVFAGKQGFITLRDLFRWAARYHARPALEGVPFDNPQVLADEGYLLLAERLRDPAERAVVQATLEKRFRTAIDVPGLYGYDARESDPRFQAIQAELLACRGRPDHPFFPFRTVVWTRAMWRLFCLVDKCRQASEPVLLVGDTGCGKTTICQILALLNALPLRIVNCHQHTEGSDFLGGLRPVRPHSDGGAVAGDTGLGGDGAMALAPDPSDAAAEDGGNTGKDTPGSSRLFEWCDGPLVLAMKQGGYFLIDEISLADDSVLERINSVLEPSRKLVLSEKVSGQDVDEIVAEDGFRVMATMNPGGDFGKKELSPALRNRFTEIWVPTVEEHDVLLKIVELSLDTPALKALAATMLTFVGWLRGHEAVRRVFSLRDLRSWTAFCNSTAEATGPHASVVHGACLVLLDAIGVGSNLVADPARFRQSCLEQLIDHLMPADVRAAVWADVDGLGFKPALVWEAGSGGEGHGQAQGGQDEGRAGWRMGPYALPRGPNPQRESAFAFDAPTTARNTFRLLRAMQLGKPVLLEGSPGVGKTSLVLALAALAGVEVARINLSEQTDVMDLFGSDLPVEGDVGRFAWREGPLLRALRQGHWVLLDELNLASQPVLEGLNACLDHRGEVFIPELNRTFVCQPGRFRLFACQNPVHQGGGRKGLPKSFLNRFTQVYVSPLNAEDLVRIGCSAYPGLGEATVSRMVRFNHALAASSSLRHSGSFTDCNLRDVFRWCDLVVGHQRPDTADPAQFVDHIYGHRARTGEDLATLRRLVQERFGPQPDRPAAASLRVSRDQLRVGRAAMPRRTSNAGGPAARGKHGPRLGLLPSTLPRAEAVLEALSQGWMVNLVGPSASGKTSLVRALAALQGADLREFAMNSSVDTLELLGGFEQVDLDREINATWDRAQAYLADLALHAGLAGEVALLGSLHSAWHAAHEPLRSSDKTARLEAVVAALGRLQAALPRLGDAAVAKYRALIDEDVAGLREAMHIARAGAFQWNDGILVEALKRGQWLLIDNVNFCSPSVLDRLNGLLEPAGVLTITERGVLDGEVTVIQPDPGFRLILAMDPRHGEISRAMRNRGVEVFLPRLDLDDVAQLLAARLPLRHARQALSTAHARHRQVAPGASSVREVLQAGTVLRALLERGAGLDHATGLAIAMAYGRESIDGWAGAADGKAATDDGAAVALAPLLGGNDVFVPGSWPVQASVERLAGLSGWATLLADAAVLNHLVLVLTCSAEEFGGGADSARQQVARLYRAQGGPTPELGRDALEVACQHFLEAAGVAHLPSREWWLKNLARQLPGGLVEEQHVLLSAAHAADWLSAAHRAPELAGLHQALAAGAQDLGSVPWDLACAMPGAFRAAADRVGPAASLAWSRQQQITALRGDVCQRHAWELLVLRADVHPSQMSFLQKSFRFKEGQLSEAHVTADPGIEHLHDALDCIDAEILAALARAERGLLRPWSGGEGAGDHSDDPAGRAARCDDEVAALRRLWGFRNFFWGSCHACRSARDAGASKAHWKFLCDTLEELVETRLLHPVDSASRHAIATLTGAWKTASVFSPVDIHATLEHPHGFRSEAAYHAFQGLAAVASRLDLAGGVVHECPGGRAPTVADLAHPAFALDQRLLATVRDATATLTVSNATARDEFDAVLQELGKVPALVEAHLPHPNDPTSESEGGDGGAKAADIVANGMELRLQCALTTLGLVEELGLLAAALGHHHPGGAAFSAEPRMAAFLAGDGTRSALQASPLAFQGLQVCAWGGAGSGAGRALALDSWHRRTWVNPTTAFPDLGEQETAAATTAAAAATTAAGARTLPGPQHLKQGRLGLAFARVLDVSAVPISHFDAKQAQLARLAGALAANANLFCATDLDACEGELLWSELRTILDGLCLQLHGTAVPSVTDRNLAGVAAELLALGSEDLNALVTLHVEPILAALLGLAATPRAGTDLGLAWVHLALLGLKTVAPSSAVDQAALAHYQLREWDGRAQRLATEVRVREHIAGLALGARGLGRLDAARGALLNAQGTAETLRSTLVYRPRLEDFADLYEALQQFLQSSCSEAKVLGLAGRLSGAGGRGSRQALEEENLLQHVVLASHRQLTERFAAYPDVAVPVLKHLGQLQHGLRDMARRAAEALQGRELGGTSLEQRNALLLALAQVPAHAPDRPTALSRVEALLSRPCLDMLRARHAEALYADVLVAALGRLRNRVVETGSCDAATLAGLGMIFTAFVDRWDQLQEAERARAEEQEALYKYKAQTHAAMTDEEVEQREVRELFPTYDLEFADVNDIDLNVSAPADNPAHAPAAGLPEASEVQARYLTPDTIGRLVRAHQVIFRAATAAAGGAGAGLGGELDAAPEVRDTDRLEVIQHNYDTGLQILEATAAAAGREVDVCGFAGHVLKTRLSRASLDELLKVDSGNADGALAPPRAFDFYRDGNALEAQLLFPVLTRMRARLRELIGEWPEHAILLNMDQIAARLLGFPIDSPLAKLLTGLGLLLKAAQDWERTASKAVSLQEHLGQVSDLVIRWRKYELESWPRVFAVVRQEFQARTDALWFPMYKLVTRAPEAAGGAGEGDAGVAATGDASVTGLRHAHASLDSLMQTSNLGEYGPRLQLLAAFHSHLAHLNLEAAQGGADEGEDGGEDEAARAAPARSHAQYFSRLQALVGNVHRYYSQFLPLVNKAIDTKRKPLEKDLKGFKKLVQWKDVNYFALKDTVEKTYRTLHRFSRDLRTCLGAPAAPVLSGAFVRSENEALSQAEGAGQPADAAEEATTDRATIAGPATGTEQPVLAQAAAFGAEACLGPGRILVQAPVHHKKLTRFAATVLAPAGPDGRVVVEQLARTIVDKVKYLQDWHRAGGSGGGGVGPAEAASDEQPATTKAGAKEGAEDKEARQQKQRRQLGKTMKRKEFAKLLRALGTIGLSYRLPDSRKKTPLDLFTVADPPTPSDWACVGPGAGALWGECDAYFVRVLGRLPAVRGAAQRPSAELSPADVARCLGYTEHLAEAVANQRQFLVHACREVAGLDGHVATLRSHHRSASTEPLRFANHGATHRVAATLRDKAEAAVQLLHELRLVEECLPESEKRGAGGAGGVSAGPFVAEDPAAWCQSSLATLQLQVDGLALLKRKHGFCSLEDQEAVSQAWQAAHELVADMGGRLAAQLHLGRLRDTLQGFLRGFADALGTKDSSQPAHTHESGSANSPDTATAAAVGRLEELAESTLKSVQVLLKTVPDTVADAATMPQAGGGELPKGVLSGTHKRLTLQFKALRVPELNTQLLEAFAALASRGGDAPLGESGAAAATTALVARLVRVRVYAEAAHHLARATLARLLEFHRAVLKLSYVLMNLFTDLLQRGFCTPQDEVEAEAGDDEEKGELDGTGMGEGLGGKDVSNEIEDEEQVLGLQDDEPQPLEEGEIEEEDNGMDMANDFDGELYDAERKEGDGSDEEDEPEDEQDMDEQMGKTESGKDEVLDQKLWGEEEEEEQEPLSEGEDNTGGTEAKGQENVAGETGEDNDDAPQRDQRKRDEQQQEEEEGDADADDGMDSNNAPEPNGDDAATAPPPPDDNAMKEEEEAGEADGNNDDDRQGAEEEGDQDTRTGQEEGAPEEDAPDLDLPDDLDLDGDDKGGAEQAEGNDDNGDDGDDGDEPDNAGMEDVEEGDDFPEAPDAAQEAPDALADDGRTEEQEAEAGAQEAEEMPDEEEEDGDGQGEDEEPPGSGRDQDAAMDEREGGQEEDGEAHVDAEGDEAGEEGPEEEQEEQTKGGEDEPMGGDDQQAGMVGVDAGHDTEADMGCGLEPEQGSGDPNAAASQQMRSADRDGDATAGAPQQARPPAGGDEDEAARQANQPFERSSDCNPNRQLGDVLQAWRDRLQVLDPAAADEEAPDDAGAGREGDEVRDAEMFEYAQEDEACEDQTLGAATAEQTAQQPTVGDDAADEDVLMEVDERPAPPTAPTAADALRDEPQPDEAAAKRPEDKAEEESKGAEEEEEDGRRQGDPMDPTADFEGGDGSSQSGLDEAQPSVHTGQAAPDAAAQEQPPAAGEEAAELEALRAELHAGLSVPSGELDEAEALRVWQRLTHVTSHLSTDLCEQLRLVLEASLATKMKGDYRTGKRLNMRKIIPYIASQFRKDKIWLRRTKPSKREYQVLVAIDDSQSMALYGSKQLALEALGVISNALVRLEVGELGVLSFGEESRVLHPLHEPFSDVSGARALRYFTFAQRQTFVGKLLRSVAAVVQGEHGQRRRADQLVSQLLFVISDSDNLYQEGQQEVERWMRRCNDLGLFTVFVILDNPEKEHSVLDQQKMAFVGGQLLTSDYMECFTDKNYIVLRDIADLPNKIADALRQWFELVSQDK